jgi:hypothetical protein
VTPNRLNDVSGERKARYAAAANAIVNTKKERQNMLDWLFAKGVRIEPSATYDDVQLQQLMLYWHFCEPWLQQKILETQPVFYLEIGQPDAMKPQTQTREALTHESSGLFPLRGGLNMSLLEDGTIANVTECSGKRFYKPTASEIPNREELTKGNKMMVTSDYDAGIATIVRRWDLGDLLTSESDGHANLYGTFFFAHEMTHGMQNLFSPLYDLDQNMIDARTRFLLLGNYDDPEENPPKGQHVKIFRGTRKNPVEEATSDQPTGPKYRAVQGANPVPHPRVANEVFQYLMLEKLLPAASARITQALELCARAGLDTAGGAVSPVRFLKLMFEDIRKVILPLTSNNSDTGPATDFEEFVPNYRKLQRYLSTKVNGATDASLPLLGKLPAVVHANDGSTSVFDAIMTIIDANTNVAITADMTRKLKADMKALQNTGMRAIRNAVPLWQVKTDRAIEMKKQASALFPNLIGRFTGYCNGIYGPACTDTRMRLGELFKNGGRGDLMVSLPDTVQDLILHHPKLAEIKTDDDLKTKITKLEWYQLGAPLGFFNAYTMEFDAEAYAMWICCPEELVEMYTRDRDFSMVAGNPMTEILNQATYASARGIDEIGNVPVYKDI